MARLYPVEFSTVAGKKHLPGEAWPETWEEWSEEYSRREDHYRGAGYSVEEVKSLGLFRALDDAGEVIAQTRQLTRDVQHVVDTDATALAAGQCLELADGAESDLDDGRAVWSRSQWEIRRDLACVQLCEHGRIGIEAYLDDRKRGRIQLIDARHYRCEYADDGVTLLQVWIVIPYYDPPAITPTGEAEASPTPHTYVRRLDAMDVETWVDGVADPKGTGRHALGEVPFVNCRFLPAGDCEHGLWAAHALTSPLALYDSLFAQITAVGNRRANPIPWLKGAKLDASSAVDKFGRWMSGIPVDGDVGYLESDLAGLAVLLEAANTARLNARETLPEFLFAGAGVAASGEALKWRAGAFTMKLGSIRERFFASLARITDLAVRYQRHQPYDPDTDLFRVVGPPLLPPDMAAELDGLEVAKRLGLKGEDVIRHLQRLGLIGDEEDPAAYALEVEDQQTERARAFMSAQPAASPAKPPTKA